MGAWATVGPGRAGGDGKVLIFHRFSMGFQWVFYGFQWVFYGGFSMGFYFVCWFLRFFG